MEDKRKTPVGGTADVSRRMSSADKPRPLPYSDYPAASDVGQHGLRPLPGSLPLVDFAQAKPYRSSRYSTVLATELTKEQLLQMAWVIATVIARREPQARYLQPPKRPPAGLMGARHTDPFGTDSFGTWDTDTQMFWIVRLTALTDPISPQDAIEVNEETLVQSLAVLDGEGRVLGAAFNQTIPPFDVEPPLREGDPFLDTVVGVWEPVYGALAAHDAEALTALSERYPKFGEAYEKGKVSHHLLIARSDDLPKDVSDKPRWVRNQLPLSAAAIASFDEQQVLRMRSALTLEDLSRNVMAALKRAHQLDNTYLIFTSDNGYQMGLHGMKVSKFIPYTEAHEVPLVVRGPGVPAGTSFDELVANIDIAPTVLDLAGVEEPGWMDGRSFEPFLGGDAPEAWRDSLLIEGVKSYSPERPAYSGVRRQEEIYVQYESGEEEYYDLHKDPYQLESRPQDAPASLKRKLEALKSCAGDGCRQAEGP